MPTFNEFTFLSNDKVHNIFFRECVPDGNIRGVVQIVHGIAEHSKRYEHFMSFLAENGFVAVADDHLGHGYSIGSDPTDQGWFAENDGWMTVVRDLNSLRLIEQAKYPGLPYFFLGHSMGSFLTRTYIINYPDALTGAVISGTGQNPGPVIAAGKAIGKADIADHGSKHLSDFIHNMAFGAYNKKYNNPRTEFDWLCRDTAVVDAYIADPLSGFQETVGLFVDMMGGLQYIWKSENLNRMNKAMPVYFMSGDMDPVGDYGKGVKKVYERFKKVGMRDVQIKLYPQGRHEMLNELNKDEVYTNVLNWLESKI